jgi:hypothetical protein
MVAGFTVQSSPEAFHLPVNITVLFLVVSYLHFVVRAVYHLIKESKK